MPGFRRRHRGEAQGWLTHEQTSAELLAWLPDPMVQLRPRGPAPAGRRLGGRSLRAAVLGATAAAVLLPAGVMAWQAPDNWAARSLGLAQARLTEVAAGAVVGLGGSAGPQVQVEESRPGRSVEPSGSTGPPHSEVEAPDSPATKEPSAVAPPEPAVEGPEPAPTLPVEGDSSPAPGPDSATSAGQPTAEP